MDPIWFAAAAALLAAALAWRQARATARRVERLSQMYWELKYQHGELRAELRRAAPADAALPAPPPRSTDGPARPTDGFVPLSSLKR